MPKFPTHFAENECLLLAFSSSLLSGYAHDDQTGHGRGRDFGTRSIFSLRGSFGNLTSSHTTRDAFLN